MNWIKMRTDLRRHPRVIAMARHLGENAAFRQWIGCSCKSDVSVTLPFVTRVTGRVTVASLLDVWAGINEAIKEDQLVPGMCPSDIDDLAEVPGFGAAMIAVGWAIDRGAQGIEFPNFEEHNCPRYGRPTPKTSAERMREYRARKKAGEVKLKPRTKRVTKTLRQNRVEKSTHTSVCVTPAHTEAFRDEVARHVATLNHGAQLFTSVSIANAWLKSYGETNPPEDWKDRIEVWAEDAVRVPELHGIVRKPRPSRINGTPSEEEVVAHAETNGLPVSSAKKFWRHYETKDWSVFNPVHWRLQLKTWVESDQERNPALKTKKALPQAAKAPALEFDELDKAFLRMQNCDPDTAFSKPRNDWRAVDEGALLSLMDWRRDPNGKRKGLPA